MCVRESEREREGERGRERERERVCPRERERKEVWEAYRVVDPLHRQSMRACVREKSE